MSCKYWVAKYVDDPIRNEPRNVGVFVQSANEDVAARLLGERSDGVFDGRITRNFFRYPQVYSQWRDYWREALSRSFDEIIKSSTPNFYVTYGGEVSDTARDDTGDVCTFVFNMLVSDGPSEAYGWIVEATPDAALLSDVSAEFVSMGLLSDIPNLQVPHPVVRNAPVPGKKVPHTPSFSQRNGKLHVMEYIDLGLTREKLIKERAGYMAFMFDDIREADEACQTYSIVRPDREDRGGGFAYARSVLDKTSKIVNWADDLQRNRFLKDREATAITLG